MSKRDNSDNDEHTSKRIKGDPVAEANTSSERDFTDRYVTNYPKTFEGTGDQDSYTIEHTHVHSIDRKDFDACFELIKTTSQADYAQSTQGWRPGHKRREMREDLMHYLLVRRSAGSSVEAHGQDDRTVVGFLSFMLTYDSVPCVPVVYVYEVHLAESARRIGLGSELLAMCEEIGAKVGIHRVMLTCFVVNTKAYQFYRRLGYTRDETSPEDRRTRNKVIKADIVILGKAITRSLTTDGS